MFLELFQAQKYNYSIKQKDITWEKVLIEIGRAHV
jgi:hypothetical protein